MINIILTGASGFVGSNVLKSLEDSTQKIYSMNRVELKKIQLLDFTKKINTNNKNYQNIHTLIHCAGLAHKPKGKYRYKDIEEINVSLPVNLFKLATLYNIKKFIFISSSKVLGEKTDKLLPFDENFEYNPQDDYSRSKYKAEKKLISLSKTSKVQLIILRPPLIYGPGVKGNFLKLIKYIHKFAIIPDANNSYLRSYISIQNFTEVIKLLINIELDRINIYLISDDNDLSLEDLCLKISNNLKKDIFKLPVPTLLREYFIKIFARNLYNKLFTNFRLNIGKFKRDTGWEPSKNDDTLEKTVDYYLKNGF